MAYSRRVFFVTHANVCVDPTIPVPDWKLSQVGRQRHAKFNEHEFVRHITAIYCSGEQKAIDGAQILSMATGVVPRIIHELHENDRSSTGFLPPSEFQQVADQFFSSPTQSIRGWESAVDAQNRFVRCINKIIDEDMTAGHIAIVAHGGVGALLKCYLLNLPISRTQDQPGTGGGNYFVFLVETRKIVQEWLDIGEQAHLRV